MDPVNGDDGLEGGRGQAPADCAASRDTQLCSLGKELSLGQGTIDIENRLVVAKA